MPLEMVDDPQDPNEQNQDDSSDRGGRSNFPGGGGGSLLNLLPLLLGLFRGKGSILLILLVAGGFFLMRNNSCNGLTDVVSQFTKGGMLDPNQFKKASVYEGLEDDNTKNPLPEAVSLAKFAPQRLNQGQQGSCVAWSSAYAARTIVESISTNQDPNQVAFSPSFLYNQIGLDGCQGSYIIRAMEFMTNKGAVPFQEFPYDETDCSRQPNQFQLNDAAQYRMHGFNRLTEDDGVNNISLRAIKEHLAKDAPVVIGMMVGGSFMQDMMGQKIWYPTEEDYSQMGFGGHAMCVVGYDDRLEGGAFQIMNSWGTDWGQNGIAWVRYSDFKQFVREAYGVDPMPKKGAALNTAFACNIGLVNNDSKSYIPLRSSGANVFSTISPVARGTKFKIEIKNESECYIYLFTPNKEGKSFVLFPYKPIHSPYCGITGYRLFPRKESIRADEIGNKDFMGIVVSKQPLDYNSINEQINTAGGSFEDKFKQVLRSSSINNIRYKSTEDGLISFKVDAGNNEKIVSAIVEIDKQ